MTNDTDVGRIERRFRFSCKAPVDANQLRTGPMKHEERICHPDGTCLRTDSGTSEGTLPLFKFLIYRNSQPLL